jgi:hypothetical protein
MSLDYTVVSLHRIFGPALVYVALSRCRSLAGLEVLARGCRPEDVRADPHALSFYQHLERGEVYNDLDKVWRRYRMDEDLCHEVRGGARGEDAKDLGGSNYRHNYRCQKSFLSYPSTFNRLLYLRMCIKVVKERNGLYVTNFVSYM